MSSNPEKVMAKVRDCSARIDTLHGDEPRAFTPPPPSSVKVFDGAPWKGRRSAKPFTYDTAVTVQLLQRKRSVLRAQLPPLREAA